MTQLRVQWLPPTQLILHLPTMATSLILDIEVIILLMDPVRRAFLPARDAYCALVLAFSLVFVHLIGGGGERRGFGEREGGCGCSCFGGEWPREIEIGSGGDAGMDDGHLPKVISYLVISTLHKYSPPN